MRLIFVAAVLGAAAGLAPSLAHGEYAQMPDGLTPRRAMAAVVRGTIRLVRCDAVAADIRVSTGGRISITVPDRNERSLFRFNIAGLRRGIHTVTPLIAPGRCHGGEWMPTSRDIDVRGPREVIYADFEYLGPAR